MDCIVPGCLRNARFRLSTEKSRSKNEERPLYGIRIRTIQRIPRPRIDRSSTPGFGEREPTAGRWLAADVRSAVMHMAILR